MAGASRDNARELRSPPPRCQSPSSQLVYSLAKLREIGEKKCTGLSRKVKRKIFALKLRKKDHVCDNERVFSIRCHISTGKKSKNRRKSTPRHHFQRFLRPLPRCPRHRPQLDRNLTLGLLNVRSLHGKIDDVLELRQYLSLDIFCLVETWHDADSVCIKRLRKEGLTVIEKARPRSNLDTMKTNHGGLAIACDSKIVQTQVCTDVCPLSFELVCSSFVCGSESFYVILIYRTGPILTEFFKELSDLLDDVASSNKPIFVAGDFNVHIEKRDDHHGRTFLELMSSYGLHCHVTSQTHDCGGTLDLLFSRNDSPLTNVSVSDPGLSDHRLLTCFVPVMKPPLVYHTIRFRPWSRLDKTLFQNLLSDSIICKPDAWHNFGADELAELFDETMNEILDKLIPFRSSKLRRRKSDPWYDSECHRSKRQVRRCERIFRRIHRKKEAISPDELISTYLSWIDAYRSYRHLLHSKRRFFWSRNILFSSHPRELWQSMDRLLGRGRCQTHSSISANKLLEFFMKKASDVRNSSSNTASPPDFTSCVPNNFLNAFAEISIDSVLRAVKKLPNKSSANEILPVSILKDFSFVLAPFLTHMFNASLSTGVFPNGWKQFLIKPIMKKGKKDPHDVNSYRPICNLHTLSKIFEKLLAEQLKAFLSSNNLFPQLQSAYRQNHSTETAILKVTMDIFASLDKGDVCLASFLDFSSAFDCVDHDILLKRLDISFGIRGCALELLSSFLRNRLFSVTFNNQRTKQSVLKYGVPQGSVLGPLLFTLYVSDLISLVESHSMHAHMYADDLQIYCFSTPGLMHDLTAQMSRCFDDVTKWCFRNRLLLNANKTELMWFSSQNMKRSLSSRFVEVCLGNVSLTPKTQVKCLGVVLDDNLTFRHHVSKTVCSSFSSLRQIRSVSRCIPQSLLIKLVNALVLPQIDYCIASLTGISKLQSDRLQRVLNASARLIFNSGRYCSISPLLQSLGWLPISSRIEYRLAVLAHSCVNGRAPDYLQHEITPVSSLPNRSRLRSSKSMALVVPPVRRPTLGGRSFRSAAAMVWNSLPPQILSVDNPCLFKRAVKDHFLKGHM